MLARIRTIVSKRVARSVHLKKLTNHLESKRQFSKKHRVTKHAEPQAKHVLEVFRGINSKLSFFHPAAILVGLPSRKAFTQSRVVSASELVTHKHSSQKESENYYLSASFASGIASLFGKRILKIDATHPQQWFDAERTYYNIAGIHYEHPEEESVTLAALIATIKSIMDKQNNEEVDNPFYLPIDPSDDLSIKQYEKVYVLYCDLLVRSNPLHAEYNAQALPSLIKCYTNDLIRLYDKVLGKDSPFNLTLPQFGDRFPAFAKEMCAFNHPQFSAKKFFGTAHSDKRETVGGLFRKLCASLFMQHHYIPKKGII